MRTTFVPVVAALTLMFWGCSDKSPIRTGADGPDGRLYVLNQGENTLWIYDTKTLARLDTITLDIELPHYIEFSPDGQHYYITTLETSGHAARFDAKADTLLASVAVPPAVMPSAIAIDGSGQYGYVSNFSTTTQRSFIHKYNLATMTWVKQLQAGATTHDLKATSDGSLIVACNRFSNDVTLIATETDDVDFVGIDPAESYPLGMMRYGPMGVAIDHRDSLAYIACMDMPQVRYLDLAARAIVDSTTIPVSGHAGMAGPMLLAVSPDGSRVFVTTQMGNSLVVFDPVAKTVLADLHFETDSPFGVVVSEDGSRVYVTCVGDAFPFSRGRVYIIDGVTLAKLDSLEVGNQCYGIAWQANAGQ